jgi:hypothetical protein
MLAKKIAVLAAALAVSAPALADRGHRDYYRHGHRVVHQHHYVAHRPVVHHYYYRPVYRPAPRPVYVVHQPPPVYHYSHPHTGAAILVGAVLGAAIVHHAITGY